MRQDIQSRAIEIRAARDAQIPKEYLIPTDNLPLNVSDTYRTCGLLTEKQLGILALDATALAQSIASKEYSATEVIETFIISASVAQQTINCLASLDANQARARAKWLDEELERTGKPVGPLHGVPISVKGESNPMHHACILPALLPPTSLSVSPSRLSVCSPPSRLARLIPPSARSCAATETPPRPRPQIDPKTGRLCMHQGLATDVRER